MNVRINESGIHGMGVFANEVIKTGDWTYMYGEFRIMLPGDPYETFAVEVYDKVFIPYAPFCFVNHSDNPNCEMLEDEESLWPMLYIRALRRIKRNEELTFDYGYDPSTN